MNSSKVSKYHLKEYKNLFIVFYLALLSLGLYMSWNVNNTINRGEYSFLGGFGIFGIIFAFVIGLNFFKSTFYLMQNYNVSRKSFLLGSFKGLLVFSLILSVGDIILTIIFKIITNYLSVFEQIHGESGIIKELIWSFSLLLFVGALGLMITMIYFRSNTPMKIAVSISPVMMFIVLDQVDTYTSGKISIMRNNFVSYTSETVTASVITLTIGTLIILGFCYLLIRKATLKLQ